MHVSLTQAIKKVMDEFQAHKKQRSSQIGEHQDQIKIELDEEMRGQVEEITAKVRTMASC